PPFGVRNRFTSPGLSARASDAVTMAARNTAATTLYLLSPMLSALLPPRARSDESQPIFSHHTGRGNEFRAFVGTERPKGRIIGYANETAANCIAARQRSHATSVAIRCSRAVNLRQRSTFCPLICLKRCTMPSQYSGLGGVGAGELLRLFAGGRELFSPGRIASSLPGFVEAGTGLRKSWISATASQQTAAEGLIGVYDGGQLLLFGVDQDHSRLHEVTLGE